MWRSLQYYVAENPWYLVGGLALIGGVFLIALRVTQDGKNLMRALIALGLAGLVLVVEQFWVTEAERIEWVVKDLADAIAHSDGDRVLSLMDEHVTFSMRSNTVGEELDLDFVRKVLGDIDFDWVHVSRLTTSAGEQTHRGTADFRVNVSGTYRQTLGTRSFLGPADWSFGFRRTPAGQWKITRIAVVSLPPYVAIPLKFKPRKDSNSNSTSNSSFDPEPGPGSGSGPGPADSRPLPLGPRRVRGR
jgi:ketosteroid isomerase-like protein